VTPAYSGGRLDRAGARRADPGWIAGALARPDARVIPMWRDRCLVAGDPPVPVRPPAAVLDAPGEVAFLGLDGGAPVFAVDLSALAEDRALAAAGAARACDVRALVGALSPAEAATQAYARGLLYWHRGHRFCGACGAGTESRDAGHARACLGCERLLFPRIEPAIIVVVQTRDGERCLLARHRGAGPDGYALLAGFVEVGESLEDAVRREVAEEAGLPVGDVAYRASQAWPFPAGLMVGFHAVADADADVVVPDGAEVVEVRWFTRAELAERTAAGHRPGRPDSIDRVLIESWLAGARPAARPPAETDPADDTIGAAPIR
jgi:NAD+ diphosphatase